MLAFLGLSAALASTGQALDPGKSVFQFNCQTWTLPSGLSAGPIKAITQSPEGFILLSGRAGLVRFDGTEFAVSASAPAFPARPGAGQLRPALDPALEKLPALSVATDPSGDVWVATRQGLYRYDAKFRQKETFLAGTQVNIVYVDSHGLVWAGTEGMGLARFQGGGFSLLRKADGLGSDRVTALFEDAEGSLWVGTSEGLAQLTDLRFPIYTDKEGFMASSALDVSASAKGGLWIATTSGATYFDGRRPTNFPNSSRLPNNYLRRVFVAKNEDVYFSDLSQNISVLSADGRTAVYPNQNWTGGFAEDETSVLAGVGPRLLRIEDGRLSPYHFVDKEPLLDWIYSLRVSRAGTIWVGTNHGIVRIKDGKSREWMSAEGLVSDRVDCVTEDADGAIWAGLTWGLARIKDDKLTLIGESDGLLDSRIFGLVPDNLGYLWLNCGKGLMRITRQSLTDFADGKTKRVDCQLFDGQESIKFVNRDFQAFSGCKTTDGRIWFPGPHGVIMVDPAHFYVNRVPPRVSIEKIRVAGRELTEHSGTAVQADNRGVEFFFSAQSHVAPGKMRVRYQLEHFDAAWADAGDNRSVAYDHLKPGRYVFRVQAANGDGAWNLVGDSFTVELSPPIYLRVWFYGVDALAVLLAIFGLYVWKARTLRAHQRNLRLQNRLLEAKVAQRTDELARSLSLLKAMFEHAAVGVAQIDVETGRFVQINRHFCAIMGRTQEEMKGLTLAALTYPKDIPGQAARMESISSGDLPESTREGRYLRKDGSTIWVNMTVSAMWRPGDVPDHFIVVAQDISDRKRFEEQLRHSQKMDAIGTLAGGIAHDFNNILTLINGFAQLAQLELVENPKVRDYLNEVQVAANRAASLVRQILTFSRQQPLERKPISLLPIVTETLKLLRATIPSTIEFKQSFADDVPTVLADATQIHQIVMNLATNAWYAMRDRPGILEVKLSRCVVDAALQPRLQSGVYALLSISDTGHGMDPATLGRIFEPFFTTKPAGEGTGLGLAVVHGIMGNHDGVITAHSELEKGTIFRLYFPEYTGDAVDDAPVAKPLTYGHGEQVLLVDDEELLAKLGQLALTKLGYKAHATTRADEALELVRADPRRFSLVFTDQTMPGMTGLVLARRLKEIQPDLPVVLMTGNNLSLTSETVKEAGVSQVLLKPATLHALGEAAGLWVLKDRP